MERCGAGRRAAIRIIGPVFKSGGVVLLVMIVAESGRHAPFVGPLAAAYFVASTICSAIPLSWASRVYSPRLLVSVLDASLVSVLLYMQIVSGPISEDHGLTTTGLITAFVLLSHAALSRDSRSVAVFSSIVVAAWIMMLAATAIRHSAFHAGVFLETFFTRDLLLLAGFAFTAAAAFLSASEYERTRRLAAKVEMRRRNLSRFFSPAVVHDLQDAASTLGLKRRNAAIMFIDIRGFTSYAEDAPPTELAEMLVEYRGIVASCVFEHGGAIDKFMGDGVMAVFGQPRPYADDAARALACADRLVQQLRIWTRANEDAGLPSLVASVGVHHGVVIGGILGSRNHDEFTVLGDAVNVAQRLQSLAKVFKCELVVSKALLDRVDPAESKSGWQIVPDVKIDGRKATIDVACRRDATGYEPE